jgi:hypothetical protein
MAHAAKCEVISAWSLSRRARPTLPAYVDTMRRGPALFGSAIFLVIAPWFVAGVAPKRISHWRPDAPFPD